MSQLVSRFVIQPARLQCTDLLKLKARRKCSREQWPPVVARRGKVRLWQANTTATMVVVPLLQLAVCLGGSCRTPTERAAGVLDGERGGWQGLLGLQPAMRDLKWWRRQWAHAAASVSFLRICRQAVDDCYLVVWLGERGEEMDRRLRGRGGY